MSDLKDLEQTARMLRSDVDMLVYRLKQVVVRLKALEVAIERKRDEEALPLDR